jgi:hypothetical protein
MSAQSSPITSTDEVGPLQQREETIPNLGMKMPMPVHYVLGRPMHSNDDDDDDSEYAETTASSDSLFDFSEINREGRPLMIFKQRQGTKDVTVFFWIINFTLLVSSTMVLHSSINTHNQAGDILSLSYFAALEPCLRTAW